MAVQTSTNTITKPSRQVPTWTQRHCYGYWIVIIGGIIAYFEEWCRQILQVDQIDQEEIPIRRRCLHIVRWFAHYPCTAYIAGYTTSSKLKELIGAEAHDWMVSCGITIIHPIWVKPILRFHHWHCIHFYLQPWIPGRWKTHTSQSIYNYIPSQIRTFKHSAMVNMSKKDEIGAFNLFQSASE